MLFMKKLISMLLICTFLMLTSFIGGNSAPVLPDISGTGARLYSDASFDWDVYNIDGLIKKAAHVFIGEITDISFNVNDRRKNDDEYFNIYFETVYGFKVVEAYKGAADISQFRIPNGLKDCREDEQFALLGEYGADCLPITETSQYLQYDIGEKYLFVLYQHDDYIPTVINAWQSSFNLKNPTKISTPQNIRGGDSKAASYNGIPLFSAMDIIKFFGEDKWENFLTQWQIENPL